MDDSHRNPLQEADAIETIAGRRELTTKQVEPDPEAGRARGMARGLTLLTMLRRGKFRLGVKTGRGVLDVTEAATVLHMHTSRHHG